MTFDDWTRAHEGLLWLIYGGVALVVAGTAYELSDEDAVADKVFEGFIAGPFWPLWVVVGTFVGAVFAAISVGRLPALGVRWISDRRFERRAARMKLPRARTVSK